MDLKWVFKYHCLFIFNGIKAHTKELKQHFHDVDEKVYFYDPKPNHISLFSWKKPRWVRPFFPLLHTGHKRVWNFGMVMGLVGRSLSQGLLPKEEARQHCQRVWCLDVIFLPWESNRPKLGKMKSIPCSFGKITGINISLRFNIGTMHGWAQIED